MSEKDWVSLVRSIAGGDQGALRTIYEQTHRIVFTLMVRITKNRETAEEVTVDVFHDVWRRASTYDPSNGPVIGWIMNQARSRAIDRLRFEQRKKRVNNEIHHLRNRTFECGPAWDLLVRLAPGTDYPPHQHAGVEELYLLEGELMIDDKKIHAGDFIRAEAGSVDHRVWSETGCTCLLLTSTKDTIL